MTCLRSNGKKLNLARRAMRLRQCPRHVQAGRRSVIAQHEPSPTARLIFTAPAPYSYARSSLPVVSGNSVTATVMTAYAHAAKTAVACPGGMVALR